MSHTRCIFCRASLGRNTILAEHPLGARLAFDTENARLWIVCPRCARWNLAALDQPERRDAVAKLDQFYSATPSHHAEKGIGIAEVGRATLIRVGGATWPQFAAWRYGRRLRRRRYGWFVFIAVLTLVNIFNFSSSGDAFLETNLGLFGAYALIAFALWYIGWRTRWYVPLGRGTRAPTSGLQIDRAEISVREAGWSLLVAHRNGASSLRGPDAVRALALLMPLHNGKGATDADIADAIYLIERAGGPENFFHARLNPAWLGQGNHPITSLPLPLRLALEIAAHEETERRILRGELAALTLDWRQAAQTATVAEELAW